MSAGRPRPVTRHLRRPLWWLAISLTVSGIWLGFILDDAADEREARVAWPHLVARVPASYEGGRHEVPVIFEHPVTHETIQDSVVVVRNSLLPTPGGTMTIAADPANPDRVVVPGDGDENPDALIAFAIVNGVVAVAGLSRWRAVRQIERMIGSGRPAFAMTGALARGGYDSRRVHLHLYALDAPVGARPVCTYTLLTTAQLPIEGAAFPVEVRGRPVPGSAVVAYGGAGVLWPLRRPMRPRDGATPGGRRRTTPPVARGRARRRALPRRPALAPDRAELADLCPGGRRRDVRSRDPHHTHQQLDLAPGGRARDTRVGRGGRPRGHGRRVGPLRPARRAAHSRGHGGGSSRHRHRQDLPARRPRRPSSRAAGGRPVRPGRAARLPGDCRRHRRPRPRRRSQLVARGPPPRRARPVARGRARPSSRSDEVALVARGEHDPIAIFAGRPESGLLLAATTFDPGEPAVISPRFNGPVVEGPTTRWTWPQLGRGSRER